MARIAPSPATSPATSPAASPVFEGPLGRFVADGTIPGLGASDLVRRAGAALGAAGSESAAASLRSELATVRAEARLARDLRGLDARALADIGLDRRRG